MDSGFVHLELLKGEKYNDTYSITYSSWNTFTLGGVVNTLLPFCDPHKILALIKLLLLGLKHFSGFLNQHDLLNRHYYLASPFLPSMTDLHQLHHLTCACHILHKFRPWNYWNARQLHLRQSLSTSVGLSASSSRREFCAPYFPAIRAHQHSSDIFKQVTSSLTSEPDQTTRITLQSPNVLSTFCHSNFLPFAAFVGWLLNTLWQW